MLWQDQLAIFSAAIGVIGLIITIITLIRTGIIKEKLKKQEDFIYGQTFYKKKYNENKKTIKILSSKSENDFDYNDFIAFRKLLGLLDYCDVVFNDREKNIIKTALNYCNNIYLYHNSISNSQAKKCLDLISEVNLVLESKEDV